MLFGVLVVAPPAFAHAKHKLRLDTSLVPLDTALQSNDLVTAQAVATSIYQQAVKAFTSADPTIIIDPLVVTTQKVALTQCKTAFAIADSFYRHADLADAKQWATTATVTDSLSDPYARRATVLLGNIAYAMDQDDVAVTNFLSVIMLPNLYMEQASAYAGLLDVLMFQKQDDQVSEWVQNGQAQFAGGGDLQLAFLQDAERVLKHRNHPLWRDLDQQIVDLFPNNAASRLQALRELASNARKFERWAEAETNYAALCAMTLPTARDTVDTWFLLAECQAKQNEDATATLSNLTAVCAGLPDAEDCEYGMYRLGKFYEEQGNFDSAAANYELLAVSPSASTWAGAAFHQLGALKEKQGDLPGALQLYLQYPQRFPQDEHFVIQSYASALNVADALGDTNAANLVYSAITNSAAAIQDYNVVLNLSLYFETRNQQLARSFLESGLLLAWQALSSATDPAQRALIHYRILRRINDFDQFQRILDHLGAYAAEFPGPGADPNSDNNHLQCYAYKAIALYGMSNQEDAVTLLATLLDQAQGNAELEGKFGEDLALLSRSSNPTVATQLFAWVTQKFPSHPWANIGRLRFAIQAFNAKDFTGAMKLANDIINALPEKMKMPWMQDIYWSAIYLRGSCLEGQGQTQEGAALKQLAMSKVPSLSIQRRLH
jgi:TolA-binding protein